MASFSASLRTRFLVYLLYLCVAQYSTSCYSSEMDVEVRQELCEGEKAFIQKRLPAVRSCLQSHGIDRMFDIVPRMALLGSGGGQRAQIAFLSVLQQLGEHNLLDCFLYLAGVSGSTWAMASVYDDANWSQNVTNVTRQALKSMSEGKGVTFSEGVQWLKGRYEEGDLSLSDAWGVIVCDLKGVPLETRTLSGEGSRGQGVNPYPLYSAINRALYDKDEVKDMWFDLNPHEAGFTDPGAFIKMSLLKQEFKGGRVEYSPKRKPMDMVQLQGICGSVFGNEEQGKKMVKGFILNWIKSLWTRLHQDASALTGGVIEILMALVELVESMDDVERFREVLGFLKILLGEEFGKLRPSLLELDYEMWTHMNDQERKQQMENIFGELIGSSERWGPDLNLHKFHGILSDVWWVIKHILPLFYKWQFGTVPNFLYQFHDSKVPEEMSKKQTMHLIDAGLFLNSAYPSVLREAREVDIIVSFDFSMDDPFGTLKQASDYAAANNRPFPKIDFTKLHPDHPESFYVFEEEGKPTIIHIPLFNINNCENEATIAEDWKEYTTLQMIYRDKKKIDHLADLAAFNVKMNRDGILKQIRKTSEQRSKAICQFVQDMRSC